MNDDNFSGDKIYEKQNNYSKWMLTPRQIVIISGGLLFVVVFLWILNITGVISISDNNAPNIYLNGTPTVDLMVDQPYDDSKIKAIDNKDGDVTSKMTKVGTVDTTKPGTYVVIYTVEDKAGNKKTVNRTIVVKADKKGPNVKFAPNGVASEKEDHTTKVTVSDPSGIKVLKYLWTTSTTTPSIESFVTDFTSGTDIKTPSMQTGTYYLWVYTVDNKNNQTIEHSNVFKLKHDDSNDDKTAPIVSFTPNGNSDSAVNQVVTININDQGVNASGIKIAKYQWSKDSSKPSASSFINEFTNGQVINSPANVTGNYYLWVYVEDNMGNSDIVGSEAYQLKQPDIPPPADTTPPKVVFSPNGNGNTSIVQNAKVTVNDPSGVQLIKYQWNTSYNAPTSDSFIQTFTSGQTLSSPANISGNYYLWIYAVDNKGNNVTIRSNVFKIGTPVKPPVDKTPPTVTFAPNGNKTIAKVQSTKVTVSDPSGIKSATYNWTFNAAATINSNDIKQPFTSGQTLSTPNPGGTGEYYLWIYVTDNKGNSAVVKSNTFYVGDPNNLDDKTPPSISFSMNGNANYAKSYSPKVTLNDLSGVKTAMYQWTTSSTAPAISTFKTAFTSGQAIATPSSVNGKYYLWIYAEDIRGNKTTTPVKSNSFSLDNTKPNCKVNDNGYNYKWTKSNVKINVTCSDSGGSSVSKCAGKSGSSSTITYSSSTNKKYSYTVEDKAGNTNTCSISGNIKIDKTGPTCTKTKENRTWTNKDISVTMTWKDAGVGVKSGTPSPDKRTWNGNVTVETYTQYAYDALGNKGSCEIDVYHDKTKPTCVPTTKVTTWINATRKMTIKCEDEQHGSGLGKCADETFSTSWNYYLYMYNKTLTYSSTTKTGVVYVTDRAGNSSFCAYNVYVDKVKPNQPIVSRTSSGSNYIYDVTCGSDSNSGLDSGRCLQYCSANSSSVCDFDGNYATTRTFSKFTVAKGKYLCVRTKDLAGNISSAVCQK